MFFFVVFNGLYYSTVVFQILPEEDLVTRDVHFVSWTVQLVTELRE